MILPIIAAYFGLVILVGILGHRMFRSTGEDYFMASRTIGSFLLLMSLFGTHMTAFSLLGASGESYLEGIGVFGLMASSSAIVAPAVFFFIGIRFWSFGKRNGFVTQVELVRARWESDRLGLLLFVVLLALLIPYLLIGVMGGGITLEQISGGVVPQWAGSLLVCAVVLFYVSYGGLRSTAWANAFQTLVFMTLGVLAFVIILRSLGGLSGALDQVRAAHPHLLVRGDHIQPLKHISYAFIGLSAATFPHITMHWLTAQSARTFRIPVVLYPLCIAAVWIPSVLLGVFGRITFPDLQGPEANSVLVRMIDAHAPEVLAGLLVAGVLAAVMSSLDSQVLAVGTMFTRDIVRHYGFHDAMTERQQVLYGRIFVAAVIGAAFVLSLVLNRSIFKLGIWSFTGFASLLPIPIAACYWKRSTAAGVVASVVTVAALWLGFLWHGWDTPGYTVGGSGLLPVAVILPASFLALAIGSWMSKPPSVQALARFFPDPSVPEEGPASS